MRRNPLIPLSGASFVTNPRKRNTVKTKKNTSKAKKASPTKRIVMRLNRAANFRPSGAMSFGAHRGATLARLRMNGLALRTNGLAYRKNGLALRTNGLALRTNGIQATVQSAIAKVPVIGQTLAGAVGPVVVGLAAGAVHLFVVGKYGHMLPAQIQPIGYTLGGVGIATLVRFVPLGSPTFRTAVGAAAITVGAALDLIRYLKDEEEGTALSGAGAGGYGEGGMWQTVDYSDASPMDAYECGGDLGADEIAATRNGPGGWVRSFARIRRATRIGRPGTSANAGQQGHRWGWAIRLLGFENFAKLAAMPQQARQEYIAKLRQYAVAALPGGQTPAQVHQSYQGAVVGGY